MRTLLGFALLFMAATSVACGDDLDGESLVGATCSKADDCDVSGVCVSGKDGLCSLHCEAAGQPQQCPLGSYCDDREVETSDDARAQMTLCFPACNANSDCRGGYSCKGVTKGSGKVCVPNDKSDD
jgi:hypothetical protein